jgi:hypothetical protein
LDIECWNVEHYKLVFPDGYQKEKVEAFVLMTLLFHEFLDFWSWSDGVVFLELVDGVVFLELVDGVVFFVFILDF